MTAILALLLAAGAPAGRTFAVDPAASTLTYQVVHKLHRVDGRARQVEGKAVLQPDGSVLTMVRAPVASFDSGDSNRDAHVLEVLETAKFPFVVLKGAGRLEGPLAASAGARELPLALDGEVELHGVKQRLTIPVTLALRPDGTARARGAFEVSLERHAIERPALLFVKVDDTCRIDFDLSLREVTP